jgi:hypothetical protein
MQQQQIEGNTPSFNIETSIELKPSKWTTKHLNSNNSTSNWIFHEPKFKYCKKRKEFFSDEFSETWYKSPYKYHMILEAENIPNDLKASLEVIYEDSTKIEIPDALSLLTKTSFKQSRLILEPFQFNICSYKLGKKKKFFHIFQDGKKFRLQIGIHTETKLEVNIISPPFCIKSKKPISKPGSQIQKRKKKFEETISKGALNNVVDLSFSNQNKFRSEFIFSNSPLILPKRLLPKIDEQQQNQVSFKNSVGEFHGVTSLSQDTLQKVEKISSQENDSKKVPKYMMKLMRFNDSLATKHFE